jgi:GNAT superfamily N-acetyltransferase
MADVYPIFFEGKEEIISLVAEPFTANNHHLAHLKLWEDSGMGCWLSTAGTQSRTWIGIAPTRCVVAYNAQKQAIGWCALGYLRRGVDVIGTYVLPIYRGNGIGALLAQKVLADSNEGQETIAYDDVQWDIIHLIRRAGLKPKSLLDYHLF